MHCDFCGSEIEDGSAYCAFCGARVAETPAQNTAAPQADERPTAPQPDAPAQTYGGAPGANGMYGSAPGAANGTGTYGGAPHSAPGGTNGSPRLIYDPVIGGYRPATPAESAGGTYLPPKQRTPRLVYDPAIGGYRPATPQDAPNGAYVPPQQQAQPKPAGYNVPLVFGILSLVFSVLSFVLSLGIGLAGTVCALVFGIIAIVQGKKKGNRAGKTCGIVGTVFSSITLGLILLLVILGVGLMSMSGVVMLLP